MTTSTAPTGDWTVKLRRQKAWVDDGRPDGGYTKAFEIICRDCGDDPGWDYQDVPPRLQRIRGPYRIEAGIRKYGAHIAWHDTLIHAR